MSSFGDDTPTLIQTKLHRPRLGQDLIPRPHLVKRLNQGMERKLTLISAQAGAGKSTLLAQWLGQCPRQSARLSLDEYNRRMPPGQKGKQILILRRRNPRSLERRSLMD